jgi:PAS domain S-box-containing protein
VSLNPQQDSDSSNLIQQPLEDDEDSYKALVRNLPAIVYRVHLRDGNRMEFFGGSLQRITGYREEELACGQVCHLDPLIPEPHRARVVDTVRRAVLRNHPFSVEYPLRRKDGTLCHLLEQGAPVWRQGSPLFIDGVIFEVTTREKARQELEAQGRQQRALGSVARRALEGAKSSVLYGRVVHEIATALGVELVRLAELLPGGESARVRTALGFRREGPSPVILPAGPGSWIGRSLAAEGPLLLDPAEEGQGGCPDEQLRAHGVQAGISVAIPGADGPWGVLEAYTAHSRSFETEELRFLHSVADLLGLAMARALDRRLLEEREQSLRAQFNGLPIPTYIWRRRGSEFVLLDCNMPAYVATRGDIMRWLGSTLEQMYGDMPEVLEDFQRCYREKTVVRREIEYRFRDSDRRGQFAMSYVYVPPDSVMVHAEEITDRKRAEATLREQAQIIDQVHDAVVGTDMEGNVTSWNRGAERLFGYSAADALGRHVSFVYQEEQRQLLKEQIIAPLKEKGSHRVDVQMRKRSGETFHARLYLSLLKDQAGRPVGMLGYSIDDTERVRARDALAATARRLAMLHALDRRILANRSPEAIADAALRGLHTLVPFTGGDILVLEADRGEARVLSAWASGGRVSVRQELFPMARLGELEAVRKGEIELVPDTEDRPDAPAPCPALPEGWVRAILRAPLLAHGELLGLLNLGSDRPGAFTTEHVAAARDVARLVAIGVRQARLLGELELRREQLQRLARELLRTQEEQRLRVARTLHEDTAQVISALKMTLNLMELDIPEELPGLKKRARDAAGALDDLVRRTRLLAYGLRPLALDTVGLDTALEGLCRQFSAESGVPASYRGDGSRLPEPADPIPVTLYRLLQEALENVRRHAQAGEVRVALQRERGEVVLTVEDDGKGFDMGLALSREDQEPGHGLSGLRELFRLLDGELTVESRPGGGSTLIARLPVGRPPS